MFNIHQRDSVSNQLKTTFLQTFYTFNDRSKQLNENCVILKKNYLRLMTSSSAAGVLAMTKNKPERCNYDSY